MSSVRPELKFTDGSEERLFFQTHSKLPLKDEATLRIVDRNDYYTLLDEDAIYVADSIYKTSAVLKENRGHKYVTISPQVLTTVLKDALLSQNKKIEIYDKSWKLLKNASPGNLEKVEELLAINLDISPVVVAIKSVSKSDGKTIGLCFVDTSTKEIGISEFSDNDLYSNLEAMLIQLGVKECVIPSRNDKTADPDTTKLEQTIDKCGIVISNVRQSEFNTKDIEQDLARLLDNELVLASGSILESTLALSSANALLVYLGLMSDDSNFGAYQLKTHTLDKYMKLDSSAVRALNLFPNARDGNARNSSIYGLLNKCKSSAGSRLLSQWIKQPLTDLKEILKRHSLVELLINDQQLRLSLHDEILNGVPDIRRLIRKLNKKNATLEDVIRIYQLVLQLPGLMSILDYSTDDMKDNEDLRSLVNQEWYEPIKEYTKILSRFQAMVEETVDLNALENHEYIIRPEFDESLQEIRAALNNIRTDITRIHLDTAEDLGMDSEKKLKLENHQQHGWCMRLTRNDSSVLRGNKNYQELQTVKAGVFFTTRELKECSVNANDLQKDYDSKQASLVSEIVSITSGYSPVLEKLSLILANIDVLVSFAHVSSFAPIPYVRPKMNDINSADKSVILKEARHPCLESQDDINFISNDVELIKNAKEFLIITGPNMGGKSTYIRQIGVISLLAQIGCFVPCTEAELTIFDAILSRVGAGDSQLKGLSTFMAEMLETSSILKSATENSLIIIDELGRGTSTYDGFGLAWAISEFIITKIKCFTLFATHFHELTTLSNDHSTVGNLHVVAHINDENISGRSDNNNDITLLYKVEPGISDKSFGIHVAEVVKFPRKIINMAKRKAAELEDKEAENDPYIRDKRSKCNSTEIASGVDILKSLLKRWKSSVDLDSVDSKTAIEKLKELIDNEFKDKIDSDKFIQEIMTGL